MICRLVLITVRHAWFLNQIYVVSKRMGQTYYSRNPIRVSIHKFKMKAASVRLLLNSFNDCRYVNKFLVIYPLPQATTGEFLKRLKNDVNIVDIPKKLLTDNGTQFVSNKWQSHILEHNIKHILPSVYRPQSNLI